MKRGLKTFNLKTRVPAWIMRGFDRVSERGLLSKSDHQRLAFEQYLASQGIDEHSQRPHAKDANVGHSTPPPPPPTKLATP